MSRKKIEGHFSGYFDVTKPITDFVNNSHVAWGDTMRTGVYITKVIYNNPATIVFWSDGIKSVSKCSGEDVYEPQVGLLIATLKRFSNTAGKLYDDWHPEFERSSKMSVITTGDVRKRNRVGK